MVARAIVAIFAGIVLSATAEAQVTAQGRARGSYVELGNTPVPPLVTADTLLQTAMELPGLNFFDVTVGGASASVPPLAEVITGNENQSHTVGLAAGTNSVVVSTASDAVARALLGQAPGPEDVLEAVTSGATAILSCDVLFADSGITALTIAGTPVPVPGSVSPNTTIVDPALPLGILNRQVVSVDKPTGSISLLVQALDANLVMSPDPAIAEVVLSEAFASFTNLPQSCPVLNLPLFNNSDKKAAFLIDTNANGLAETGDRLVFTITVTNSGATAGTNATIVDRLPMNVALIPTSVRLDGAPVTPTVGPCTESFSQCPSAAAPSAFQCMTVAAGTIAPNQTKVLIFQADVLDGSGVCNTAKIRSDETDQPTERSVFVPGSGAPTPTPTATQTTTPLPTATATATPEATSTATPIPTSTSTPIPPATSTPTQTPVPTQTPTPTETPTPEPTAPPHHGQPTCRPGVSCP
ncbi:MAG: hypothetical protein ACREQQ_06460 [Candidatus Binatia bacterium]